MPAVNIATTVAPYNFPAGTVLGQMRFRLMQGPLPAYTQYLDVPLPASISFATVQPGDYTLLVQRQTAAGLLIGPVVTQAVTVAAPPPVVGDVPVSVVVTVA